MITGYKPSGYFVTADEKGLKIEGETRHCNHCGYTWEYRPGSGDIRAKCLSCDGLKCCRPECDALQRQLLIEHGRLSIASCIPYEDHIERQREAYDHDPRYKVLPSGIVVANDC